MRIECPRCGYCDDEDEFCEHDELEELLEDARDVAIDIQSDLMAGRIDHGLTALANLTERTYASARQLPRAYGQATPDEIVFELREAAYALRGSRVADAVYLLDRFIEHAPAATVRTTGEMKTFMSARPRAGASAEQNNSSASPAGGVAGG